MSEIKIQCPECKEHFDVSEELMGTPVECRACQHPFEITDAHIDKLAMRYFPGDKANRLEGFSKKTPEMSTDTKVHFRTAAYDQEVDPNALMPLGPRRLLAIFLGISMMIMLIIFFVLGNGEQGVMTDITNDNRWVLVGFAAFLGSLLIIFGFRKYRIFGVILALILAGGVCSMPIIYPEKLSPIGIDYDSNLEVNEPEEVDPEAELLAYKVGLGYASIEAKITEATNPEDVIAVALMRVKPAHLDTIKDYLARALKTEEIPRVYPNRQLNGLPCIILVYMNSEQSLEDAAMVMSEFGTVMGIRPKLQIVEVLVDPDTFKNSKSDVLLDENNARFYEANLDELEHIDQERQLAAVLRLSNTQKFSLRSDIAKQFKVLVNLDSFEHQEAAVEALIRWDRMDQDNASELVVSKARKMAVSKKAIPLSYLNYLIAQKVEGAGDILLYAWMKERVVHESTLIRAGKLAELALIEILPDLEPVELDSAGNVLRKIGTPDALPALLIAYEAANGDVKKSLKATIDEIKSRE
ncbi:MAG: hypothetical protein ACI9FG_000830 [Crocinitomicaceae bacterium]|jgi:hypothetical protein